MGEYRQLYVLPGVALGGKQSEDFEKFIRDQFGFRVKLAEEVLAMDADEESGLRHDLLFYVHDEDMSAFSSWQMTYGVMPWLEFIADEIAAASYPPEVVERYREQF